MPRGPIIGNYVSLTVDKSKATRYIAGRLRTLFKNAVIAYVQEIKNRVPVFSGASRKAISKLAAYAGVPVFGPGNKSLVTNTSPRGVPNQAALQREGEASESFDFEDSAETGKLFIRWSTNLQHFVTNEQFDVRPAIPLIDNAPWEIRKHAQDAFRESIDRQVAARPFQASQLFRIRRFKIG